MQCEYSVLQTQCIPLFDYCQHRLGVSRCGTLCCFWFLSQLGAIACCSRTTAQLQTMPGSHRDSWEQDGSCTGTRGTPRWWVDGIVCGNICGQSGLGDAQRKSLHKLVDDGDHVNCRSGQKWMNGTRPTSGRFYLSRFCLSSSVWKICFFSFVDRGNLWKEHKGSFQYQNTGTKWSNSQIEEHYVLH